MSLLLGMFWFVVLVGSLLVLFWGSVIPVPVFWFSLEENTKSKEIRQKSPGIEAGCHAFLVLFLLFLCLLDVCLRVAGSLVCFFGLTSFLAFRVATASVASGIHSQLCTSCPKRQTVAEGQCSCCPTRNLWDHRLPALLAKSSNKPSCSVVKASCASACWRLQPDPSSE